MKKFKKSTLTHSVNPNYFIIEGSGVISDFVRLAPNSLKVLAYKRKFIQTVEQWILPKSCRKLVLDDQPLLSEQQKSKAPIWAEVEIKSVSEADCLSDLTKHEHSLLVACDHVTDPRNLGAIARSAAFFGVPYIIVPKRRQVLLTQIAVQTSQAGFAYTKLVVVTNLNRMLEKLKNLNYWIVGADMEGENLSNVKGFYSKVCLVLGSEDKGLSKLTHSNCDRIVSIRGKESNKIDSLNVSVAAGILINQFSSGI